MSNDVFTNTHWTITLDSFITLTAASPLRIDIRKPDGTEVEKAASETETTKATVDLADTDTDQEGTWKFQIYAVISGKKYKGETFKKLVKGDFD